MNIYKVSQTINNDYDTYDSMIVYAENESNAKVINPGGFHIFKNNSWYFVYADGSEKEKELDFTWCHPDEVKVKYIGVNLDVKKEGVILASFNAG